MTTLSWLIELLKEDGFSERGRVIAYSRPTLGRTPRSRNPDFITPMSKPDLPAVERLDHAAFAPPWQMDSDALQATFHRSVVSILYHTQNRLSGYLMATATPQGIHITRVAVHPDEQRKGIGRAMILHLLDVGYRRGAPRITVNTQTENQHSRQLYGSLGFSEMRETYPVFHSDLPGG